MIPAFAIAVDGNDITKAVEAGLVSITTTDEAGFKSDSVSIEIVDPLKTIALPRKGARIEVYLGWKHTGTTHVGAYTVDKAGRGGRPSVLKISGNGADLGATSTLKAHKTRSFDNITIGTLVGGIAKEHDLKAAVGQDFANLSIAHLDQVDESDMNLLSRVAKDHGAIFKPADGHLVFTKQGEGKTVTGKALAEVAITEDMCSEWNVELSDRASYQSVIAYWQDTDGATRREVKEGDGDPCFTIRKPFPNEAAARAGAKAKKEALDRGTGAATLTVSIGNPGIFAETPLSLSGFDPQLDGKWMATKVTQSLSGSGYTTAIEAEPPA
ncbi:MAG: hypothetical protein H7Z12_15030 [Rhodospirillaceae bacterium]|nr:hypothetical protein [Rhodospirillales bacterium]